MRVRFSGPTRIIGSLYTDDGEPKREKGERVRASDGNRHDGWLPLIGFLWSALARYAVSLGSAGPTMGLEICWTDKRGEQNAAFKRDRENKSLVRNTHLI